MAHKKVFLQKEQETNKNQKSVKTKHLSDDSFPIFKISGSSVPDAFLNLNASHFIKKFQFKNKKNKKNKNKC